MADKKILNRMRYLTGHLQANLRMIEEDRYCIDIIRQNQAVMAALKKVNELILGHHLDTCVTKAISGESETERRRVLTELLEIFQEQKNERTKIFCPRYALRVLRDFD